MLSAEVRASAEAQARRQAVREAARRRELTKVLQLLSAAGIEALVLKGAALAYTHYPRPYLRPCLDADVIVEREKVEAAVSTLESVGYNRQVTIAREVILTQIALEQTARGFHHVVDLHWAISNRPLFAEMVTFGQLAEHSQPVRQLGSAARTPGAVEALLLACIHRLAHHNDSQLLIWLYDIRLLSDGLTDMEWDRFWTMAAEKRIFAVCQEALSTAAALLGGRPEVRERTELARAGLNVVGEPSAAYLGGVSSQWESIALDLMAARGPMGKLRLVAGHVFPAADYMRHEYGASSTPKLAAAYAGRAARGLWRALTRRVPRTKVAGVD